MDRGQEGKQVHAISLDARGQAGRAGGAQAAVASILGPRPRFVRSVALPREGGRTVEGLYAYAFDCDGRAVAVAGADAYLAGNDWRLAAPAGADVTDIVGRRVKGRIVQPTSSPVYVISVSMQAGQLAESCRFTK